MKHIHYGRPYFGAFSFEDTYTTHFIPSSLLQKKVHDACASCKSSVEVPHRGHFLRDIIWSVWPELSEKCRMDVDLGTDIKSVADIHRLMTTDNQLPSLAFFILSWWSRHPFAWRFCSQQFAGHVANLWKNKEHGRKLTDKEVCYVRMVIMFIVYMHAVGQPDSLKDLMLEKLGRYSAARRIFEDIFRHIQDMFSSPAPFSCDDCRELDMYVQLIKDDIEC